MCREVVVGDCDKIGVIGAIDQTIGGFGQEAMVNPYVVGGLDVDGIAVCDSVLLDKWLRSDDTRRACRDNVVNVEPVDNDIVDGHHG